jgi:hypothetical protein
MGTEGLKACQQHLYIRHIDWYENGWVCPIVNMAEAEDIMHMQCVPGCFFDRAVSNQQTQGACVECEGLCHQWYHLHCLQLQQDDLPENYICDVCQALATPTTASPSRKKSKLMGLTVKLQRSLQALPRTHTSVCYDFRTQRYPSLQLQHSDPVLLSALLTARQTLASTGVAILHEAIDVTDLNRALSSVKQGYVLSGSIAETNIWPMSERYKCIRQLPVRLTVCSNSSFSSMYLVLQLLLNQVVQNQYCTQCKVLYSTQRAIDTSLQQLHHGDAAHGKDATACLIFLTPGVSTIISDERMRYRGPGGGELRNDWRKSPLVLPSDVLNTSQSSRKIGDVIFLQGNV